MPNDPPHGSIDRRAFNDALSRCETEPFLDATCIQPHGMLLVASMAERRIHQVSDNCTALLGQDPAALLGQHLDDLLAAEVIVSLENWLADGTLEPLLEYSELPDPGGSTVYHLIFHCQAPLLLVELEPDSLQPMDHRRLHRRSREILARLQHATSLTDLCDGLCQNLLDFLAMEQVVVYRFLEGGKGTVVGEACQSDMPSYRGLRFPATDVPYQVRRHAVQHRIRMVPDMNATPATVVPTCNPLTGQAVDPAPLVLRFPHYWASQYYRNMGVRAALSLSIVQDGQLWGYVCAHHRQPRLISADQRELSRLITETFAAQIRPREMADHQVRCDALHTLCDEMMASMARHRPWHRGLIHSSTSLLAVMAASGAVVRVGGERLMVGAVPNAEQTAALMDWLDERCESVVVNARLGDDFPPARDYRDRAAGILALQLGTPGDWLVWCRPEIALTVAWAGKPDKLLTPGTDGNPVLNPRDSFERWVETARGGSEPFAPIQRELAVEFRDEILTQILRVNQLLDGPAPVPRTDPTLKQLLGQLRDVVWSGEQASLATHYISPTVEALSGHRPQDFLDDPALRWAIVHPEDRARVRRTLTELSPGDAFELEYRLHHRDGSLRWVRDRGKVVDPGDGSAPTLEGIVMDISAAKHHEQQLSHRAHHDALTGLPNRALVLDRLRQLCNGLNRPGSATFTVLYMDINNFKRINDTYGHDMGDRILKLMAERLSESLRPGDSVGRLGGDEFVVLLPGVANAKDACQAAERLAAAIVRPAILAGLSFVVTTSIGVVVAEGSVPEPDVLLTRADTAMYQAKRTRTAYHLAA